MGGGHIKANEKLKARAWKDPRRQSGKANGKAHGMAEAYTSSCKSLWKSSYKAHGESTDIISLAIGSPFSPLTPKCS